jgi:hypothetical protein
MRQTADGFPAVDHPTCFKSPKDEFGGVIQAVEIIRRALYTAANHIEATKT